MSCPANSSGLKTANAAIATRNCRLLGVTLIPAAAASSVVIYDNTSAASGTVLAKLGAVANGESVQIWFEDGVEALNGLYAVISGASAEYIVHYALL